MHNNFLRPPLKTPFLIYREIDKGFVLQHFFWLQFLGPGKFSFWKELVSRANPAKMSKLLLQVKVLAVLEYCYRQLSLNDVIVQNCLFSILSFYHALTASQQLLLFRFHVRHIWQRFNKQTSISLIPAWEKETTCCHFFC